MRAKGRAGFSHDAARAAPHAIDPLAASCFAPESTYMEGTALFGNATNEMFFVRLRDGKRYCRAKIRIYGRGPTPAEGYRVEIERWLNPTGGRNVCVVPVAGEQSEFAPADRPRR